MSRLSQRSSRPGGTTFGSWPPTTPTTAWHVSCIAALRRIVAPCPITWSRSGAPSGSPPTARSRTSRSRPRPWAPSAASCATAATTWSTSTSPTRRSSAGSPPRPRACRWWAPSTATRAASLANGIAAKLGGARRLYSKLDVRIAVSEAARWTCERFYGGRYRIVPNGVDLAAALPAHHRPGRRAARAAVRGPRRRPQGPAGAAARLRGAAQRRRATPGSRWPAPPTRRSTPLLLDPEGVHVAGPRHRRGEVAPAGPGRPALRPVAGRRELRHGAHGGVRLHDAGRGLRHRRLPRRGARRRRRPAGARRRARRARRGPAGAGARPRAPRADGARRRASAPSASPGRT